MTRNPVPFIMTGMGILLLIGCLGASQPALHITSPAYGETITTDTIPVTVETKNLTHNSTANLDPRQGHLHFYIDRAPPIVEGEPAITQPGTYASTSDTTYIWKNVTAGRHILGVELVKADDTPYNPVVRDQVQVVVT
jgi:hypothetical protein